MLGNFTYHNPTRLHFGKDAMQQLPQELARYGKKRAAGLRRRLHQEKRPV